MSDTPETDVVASENIYGVMSEVFARKLERERARKLERERDEARQLICDLLAVIHRDGGHHTSNVGEAQSVNDAIKKWGSLTRERDEARADVAILRLDAKRESEHHDRMVSELEGLYDQNAKLRKIAEQMLDFLSSCGASESDEWGELSAELDQLKEGAK